MAPTYICGTKWRFRKQEENRPEGRNMIIKVDCIGETCPVPLVEMRKALRKAQTGDIVEITGTHPASRREIPMAAAAMRLDVLSIEESGDDGLWTIRIRK
jgi:TusA-related sulfurtransferase